MTLPIFLQIHYQHVHTNYKTTFCLWDPIQLEPNLNGLMARPLTHSLSLFFFFILSTISYNKMKIKVEENQEREAHKKKR